MDQRLQDVMAEVDAWLAKKMSPTEIEEILDQVDQESEALREAWTFEW
jgi:hypothetical protein